MCSEAGLYSNCGKEYSICLTFLFVRILGAKRLMMLQLIVQSPSLRGLMVMYGFIPCAMLDYLEINFVQENTAVCSESWRPQATQQEEVQQSY